MEPAATKLDTVIRGLLGRLLDAVWGGLSRDAPRPATGAPASPAQIAALEQHWGHPLPPIFRSMLVSYNGMARLWFDVRLLAIEDIIAGTVETRRFEAGFPGLWKWIFACGTESGDALAFDPARIAGDGDIEVVHLSPRGEGKRWQSIGFLLNGLLVPRALGLAEAGDTDYYVWTNLWTFFPGACSRHSRAFHSGHADAVYPTPKELFAGAQAIDLEVLLRKHEQEQVDRRFEQALETYGAKDEGLAIVLTDASAEQAAADYYVYYEPRAHVVIALNPITKSVVIHGDSTLLSAREQEVRDLLAKTDALVKQQRVVEALIAGIDGVCKLSVRAR